MRINNVSGISAVSGVSKRRSVFKRPVDLKTAFKSSYVVPLFWDEVLPGDSVRLDLHGVIRSLPNVHATMDNAYFDIYGFFVPNRLIWKSWEKFITLGNSPSAWTEETGLIVPQMKFGIDHHVHINDLADYLGIPLNAGYGWGNSVSALPFRAYNRIINDWFVNLNTSSPVFADDSDDNRYFEDYEYPLYQAFKMPDLFTLALPSAQRGPAVSIGIGGSAPVVIDSGFERINAFSNDGEMLNYDFSLKGDTGEGSSHSNYNKKECFSNDTNSFIVHHNFNLSDENRPHTSLGNPSSPLLNHQLYFGFDKGDISGVADLSHASAITINELRLAFQTQLFYELNARCGNNRYIEYLKSVFGVSNGDARLQRAEYLFGVRELVNVSEVTQTSSSTDDTALGMVAGKVCNIISETKVFEKSFTEHGILMYVGVVRNANSYSQGIAKKFEKKTWLDFYNPVFDSIGEIPVKKKELFLANSSVDNETFGFQEAWYSYRYGSSISNSYFRAGVPESLITWTYGDVFESSPSLTTAFLKSSPVNIDRTLVLQRQEVQFLANILFDNIWTRPMSVHSIPGRIDHI